MTTLFTYGADEMATWVSNTFKFGLLKGSGYVPDKDHHFVAALTPGSNEVSVAGYTRQTATTPVRTVNTSTDRIIYSCDTIDFGTPAAGQTVTGLFLYRHVTNDADSILIAYYDIGTLPLTGASFMILVGTNGVLYLDQGA